MRSLQHKEIHKNPKSFKLPSKGILIMKYDISRFFNVFLESLEKNTQSMCTAPTCL